MDAAYANEYYYKTISKLSYSKWHTIHLRDL